MEFPQDNIRSEFDNHDGGTSSDRSLTIRMHIKSSSDELRPGAPNEPNFGAPDEAGGVSRNEPTSGADRTQFYWDRWAEGTQ
jgi:hypothetical protein